MVYLSTYCINVIGPDAQSNQITNLFTNYIYFYFDFILLLLLRVQMAKRRLNNYLVKY